MRKEGLIFAGLLVIFGAILATGIFIFKAISAGETGLFVLFLVLGILVMGVGLVLLFMGMGNTRRSTGVVRDHADAELFMSIQRLAGEISSRSSYFAAYKDGDSVQSVYDLLKVRAERDLSKAERYIQGYNPATEERVFDNPHYPINGQSKYLRNIEKDLIEVNTKLNQLVELTIQIEDSTSPIDITSADDMLSSLHDIFGDDDD